MATKKAASKKADAGIRSAPHRGTTDTTAVAAPTVGGAQEVVVTGRVLATKGSKKRTPMIVEPDSQLARNGDYGKVYVKAVKVCYYGHKRRRIGEVFPVFVHKNIKELPSGMIYLEDAEVGQDEGSRGLHSGGREDDRVREEREGNVDTKKFKKIVGKGADKIVDPTIIEDALPLGEGGNERKPSVGGAANEKVV